MTVPESSINNDYKNMENTTVTPTYEELEKQLFAVYENSDFITAWIKKPCIRFGNHTPETVYKNDLAFFQQEIEFFKQP